MQARVTTARERQWARYADLPEIRSNADLTASYIEKFCKMTSDAESLLRSAIQRMRLSARAYHRMLKLSRTIADLDGAETIQISHVAEAVQYRSRAMLVS